MQTTAPRAPRPESVIPVAPDRDPRAVKIFARTLFRDMMESGLTHDQILAMASQLIAHVTEDLKVQQPARPNGRA